MNEKYEKRFEFWEKNKDIIQKYIPIPTIIFFLIFCIILFYSHIHNTSIIGCMIFLFLFIFSLILTVIFNYKINDMDDYLYCYDFLKENKKYDYINFCLYYSIDYRLYIKNISHDFPKLYKEINEKIIYKLKKLYKMARYNENTRMLYQNIRPQIYKLYNALKEPIEIIDNRQYSKAKRKAAKKEFKKQIDDFSAFIDNITIDIAKEYYNRKRTQKEQDDNFVYIQKYNELMNQDIVDTIFKENFLNKE